VGGDPYFSDRRRRSAFLLHSGNLFFYTREGKKERGKKKLLKLVAFHQEKVGPPPIGEESSRGQKIEREKESSLTFFDNRKRPAHFL